MVKANMDIRTSLKTANIPIWACAAVMGVHENTLLRRLRLELSSEEKQPIFDAIEKIKANETNAK